MQLKNLKSKITKKGALMKRLCILLIVFMVVVGQMVITGSMVSAQQAKPGFKYEDPMGRRPSAGTGRNSSCR